MSYIFATIRVFPALAASRQSLCDCVERRRRAGLKTFMADRCTVPLLMRRNFLFFQIYERVKKADKAEGVCLAHA